jgi:diphosphomevalonate decarboxylase
MMILPWIFVVLKQIVTIVFNMNKKDVVKNILRGSSMDYGFYGSAFAPANVALIKYWGKRDTELNLPHNSSLSISLGNKGAFTHITPNVRANDIIYLNNEPLTPESPFAQKITSYLDLFRPLTGVNYTVRTMVNIPIAAGLASSSCGYAALVLALKDLYNWQISRPKLSILARLGSGSACRSIWKGFVQWSCGTEDHGMDSHGEPLSDVWPDLRIGLLIFKTQQKPISSRKAMELTVETSPAYSSWISTAEKDLLSLHQALAKKSFIELGEISESNALLMHSVMQQATPTINYSLPETLNAREKIKQLRQNGIQVYFTQDAGPNLKLLFLAKDTEIIRKAFPEVEVIVPFRNPTQEEVTLVDEKDKAIGTDEKLSAHKNGNLHRAVSVFILRTNEKSNKTEILLQQRHKDKYHSGGLWSNTCCSHPRPNEDIMSAASRRLIEEMGIYTDLLLIDKLHYTVKTDNGLTENEIDYVFIGYYLSDDFLPNENEVQDYKWMRADELLTDTLANPQNYTPWLSSLLSFLKDKRMFK